jgi:hypothetical protein
MKQYLRKVRLRASGSGSTILINHEPQAKSDLTIAFDVEKGISSTQNTAEIQLWNLSESHRNALGKELDEVLLEAGYWPPGEANNVGIIFHGNIRDVEHTRSGPDIITTLSTGDGDKAVRNATISRSYKAGTKVETVIEDIQKELEKEGARRGEWKMPKDLQPFKRPYAAVGGAKREMDILSRGFGFYWSVQNSVTEIIPGDGFIGGIVHITPDSGMVNVPTITDTGVKVAALLNPEIRPNRRVRIESQVLEMNAANGEYRVSECRYSGDNRDGDMIVFIVGEAIKGGRVDEGKKNETIENVAQEDR